jgi:hypothetical protein
MKFNISFGFKSNYTLHVTFRMLVTQQGNLEKQKLHEIETKNNL